MEYFEAINWFQGNNDETENEAKEWLLLNKSLFS